MVKYFIILLIFICGCKQKNTEKQISLKLPEQKSIVGWEENQLKNIGKENSTVGDTIDSLKNKITWEKISIHNLPFSSKIFQKELLDGDIVLDKYCCHPNCDKDYRLNDLDVLFSKNTISKELNEYEGNGHSSQKQGYFALRLPDVKENRVLIFTYYDGEASDYKLCTMEIQIFNSRQELLDKMIIEDGIAYECWWKRTFSIDSNYKLTITDYSGCIEDLGIKRMVNENTTKSFYKISDAGTIVPMDEQIDSN